MGGCDGGNLSPTGLEGGILRLEPLYPDNLTLNNVSILLSLVILDPKASGFFPLSVASGDTGDPWNRLACCEDEANPWGTTSAP